MLMLLGCMGNFRTEDGPEPVRGALFLEIEDTSTIEFSSGKAAILVVTNSSLPCRPERVEDDPETPVREDGLARKYWEGQLVSAFSREGALAVGAVLYVLEDTSFIGQYTLEANAWRRPDERVEEVERLGAAFWYRVEEAEVDDIDGIVLASEVVEYDADTTIEDPAWLVLDDAEDGVISGRFDFNPTDLSGDFHASRCENTDLAELVIEQVLSAGIVDIDTTVTDYTD